MEGDSERKKIDRGWNDPPMLSYSHSNPPPKSRIGNKRVAFPLFTDRQEKTGVTAAPVGTIPVIISNKSKGYHLDQNSAEILTKSWNNFIKVLDESDLEQKQVISKMLQNMKNMWEEQNITLTAQKLIFDISQYLVDKDISGAEQCYLALASENEPRYGNWLIGVRYLINKT